MNIWTKEHIEMLLNEKDKGIYNFVAKLPIEFTPEVYNTLMGLDNYCSDAFTTII